MNTKLYQLVAQYLGAMQSNAVRAQSSNPATAELGRHWYAAFQSRIEHIAYNFMPSGSGIDCGTKFDFERSKPDRLVFIVEFHHMDEGGVYAGWTKHDVIVRPSLASEIDVTISGRNRNDIKDYLGDVYSEALRRELTDDEQRRIAEQEG